MISDPSDLCLTVRSDLPVLQVHQLPSGFTNGTGVSGNGVGNNLWFDVGNASLLHFFKKVSKLLNFTLFLTLRFAFYFYFC